jgi:hypothetical protein
MTGSPIVNDPVSTTCARPSRRALSFKEYTTMTDTTNTPDTTDIANSDWEAKRAVHERLHAELQPRNKSALFDALNAAGISQVVVSFDGSGDSGQIEGIEIESSTAMDTLPDVRIVIFHAVWGQTEPGCKECSLADVIETVAYDCLHQKHSGWEDNEGAYGEFTFDVATRTVRLDFNARFIDSVYSQDVF